MSKESGFDFAQLDRSLASFPEEMQAMLDEDVDNGPPAPDLPINKKKFKETFLNMGEHEPMDDANLQQDEEDDISTLAHRELEQHREWRHYARLAAWEMPLLSSMSTRIYRWFLAGLDR